ncbi:MAG TPA: hypothetical protein VGM06_02570 [Polyangiaceae bacterium]
MRRIVTATALSLGALVGCSGGGGSGGSTESTGVVGLPLSISANGASYLLANVEMFIEGPQLFDFLTETDPTEGSISMTLPTGTYTSNLESWTLEKDDGTGNFLPVNATLEGSSQQSFSIFNSTTTTLTYRFQTDGVIVTVGEGQLGIVAKVDQVPPLCTPFGTDCPSGSWCPPAQLVGADVACIGAGTVAVGQPCGQPTDCVANASCFDLGSGPACTALCPASAFNGPCDSGGTCVPAGADYGVCTP